MHLQTYPEKKECHGIGRLIRNDRYMDFLLFALYRIIETAFLYERQAKNCSNSTNKLFLYYLASKNRVQHVILEMIAISNQGHPLPLPNYNSLKSVSELAPGEILSAASSENILKFAHKRAEKNLNLYLSLAALEEDTYTKKLLSTLSKLSKDFIKDIDTGYAKLILKGAISASATLTNINI